MTEFIPTYKSKYNDLSKKPDKPTFVSKVRLDQYNRPIVSQILGMSDYDKYPEIWDSKFTPLKY